MSQDPSEPIHSEESVEDELARLRAEVARLNAAKSPTPKATGAAGGAQRWRGAIAVILVVFTALLAPLSIVATWAHDQIGDTDKYLATVGPLANDPAVQAAISARLSQELEAHLDVPAVTKETLSALARQDFVPDRAGALLPSLSVPLSNAIEGFIAEHVDTFIHSSRFEQAWVAANREAHEQVVNALTGTNDGMIQVASDGTVNISLAGIITTLKLDLVEQGFSIASKIPEVDATFTIYHLENFSTVQKYVGFLDIAARVIPMLALLSLAAAVLVSRNRRKTLLAGGLAVAASMIILGITLTALRPLYLSNVPSDVLSAPAAEAIYDQVVGFMRSALRALGLAALAIAAAAFLFAPAGAGAAIRKGVGNGIRRVRSGSGIKTGRFGEFLSTYRTSTALVVVGAGAIWYLALADPTAAAALVIVVVVIAILVVLEFLTASSKPVTEKAAKPSTRQ